LTNQEFIESGMLELYAADALSPSEREEVERMAAAYPEVKAELEEITRTLEAYARLHAVKPRPELREKILRRIGGEEEKAGEEGRAIPFVPAPTESVVNPDFVRQDLAHAGAEENSARQFPYRLALAASVALILVSNVVSFYFFQNWKQAENRLVVALAREQQLAQTFRTLETQLDLRGKELAVVRDPQFEEVRMKGLEASPSSSAVVYWNPQTNQVYLDVRSLPAPPSGYQYQLWALDNGQPVDAGVIPVDGPQLQYLQAMKTINEAQAFAVTLEPEGGSQSPTLDKMYLMGEV
jgi:anti-sigma-K factor RskA